MIPLRQGPQKIKFTETERGMMAAEGWWEGGAELTFHGYTVSVLQDEKGSGDRWW